VILGRFSPVFGLAPVDFGFLVGRFAVKIGNVLVGRHHSDGLEFRALTSGRSRVLDQLTTASPGIASAGGAACAPAAA
ncbi:MAG: hypothetical protein ABW219_10600, partial [Ilumatobacteraceae bacterium]